MICHFQNKIFKICEAANGRRYAPVKPGCKFAASACYQGVLNRFQREAAFFKFHGFSNIAAAKFSRRAFKREKAFANSCDIISQFHFDVKLAFVRPVFIANQKSHQGRRLLFCRSSGTHALLVQFVYGNFYSFSRFVQRHGKIVGRCLHAARYTARLQRKMGEQFETGV